MSITGEAGRQAQAIGGSSMNREGVPLEAVVAAARRLDELSTARVISLAAEVVHKAQTGGQPLGTLSPRAIVLAPDGNVKLEAAASVAHAAPEKLRGQAGDRRSDVFSLGVLLWEALTHTALFDGATDDARKAAVLERAVRPPSELNANVPAELDAICKKALARDPVDRYQSAKVMAAELSAVLDDAGYAENNDIIVRYLEANFVAAPAAAAASAAAAAPAKPAKAAKSQVGSATTLGMAPLKAQPPAGTEPPPIAERTPSGSLSPMAFAKPATAAAASAPPAPTAAPGPGETAMIGSNLASADPTTTLRGAAPAAPLVPKPPVLPAAPATRTDDPSKTATFGSSASTPVAPAATPESGKHALPAPSRAPAAAKPSIASAETVATPALVPTAAAATPAAPAAIPGLPAMPPGSTIPPRAGDDFHTADGAKALAETQTATPTPPAETLPHPANAVSLPRPGTDKGTGPRDVLAGWGWTTGSHAIVDNDDVYDDAPPTSSRKRLVIAVAAAAGALLLIIVIAMAAGGGSKDKDKDKPTPAAATQAATEPTAAKTEPAPAPVPATPAAPVEPVAKAPEPAPVTDPEAAAKAAAEKQAADEAAAKQAKADEEAAARQAKADAAAAKQAALEAEKQAKADAAKQKAADALAAKAAAKEEAARKKAEQQAAKRTDTPRKAPPKKVAAGTPIDPYATPEKTKVDPAALYKTGFQQYVRGDTGGALATFRASLASSPGYAPTYRGLGLVYEKLGNKAQAKSMFRRYLQLSPGANDAEQIKDRMARL